MKSTGVAYVLWILFGQLGVHKFYLNKVGVGVLYACLGVIGWATVAFFVGIIPLAILGVLLFIDLFTIPKAVRVANEVAAIDQAKFEKSVEAAKSQI